MQAVSGEVLLRRNYLACGVSTLIVAKELPGKLSIRENVFRGNGAIGFSLGLLDPHFNLASANYEIVNNTVDVSHDPVTFSHSPKDGPRAEDVVFPRRVTIVNNVLRSQDSWGIGVNTETLRAASSHWDIRANSYQNTPQQCGEWQPLRPHASDIVLEEHVLSREPSDRDYLRIPASSPLARSGAGEQFPSYVGALSPGSAPEQGDWFTKLRDMARGSD